MNMLRHEEGKAAASPAAPPAPRMSAPKVSVVLPTRNRSYCLGEAIDSIRAQTFEDWELIVVDDGSEDDTRTLVRSYCARDSRIRYVRQPHGGCARALNTGLRLVRGDYLFKIDDDDVAHADLLEICAAGLDARPDHCAVTFKFTVYVGNQKDGWEFHKCNFGNPLFFRVSLLRALKGWKEFYVVHEDTELHLRGVLQCRRWLGWRCKTPLYDYRFSRTANSRFRLDDMDLFGNMYIVNRKGLLAKWGMGFDPPESQTLRQAAGDLSGSHRRNGLLPSARFAHWQQRALSEIYAGEPKDFHRNVFAPLEVRPRFPWAPLWKAEWAFWRYLQVLRMPLPRRVAAMWTLARDEYFCRDDIE